MEQLNAKTIDPWSWASRGHGVKGVDGLPLGNEFFNHNESKSLKHKFDALINYLVKATRDNFKEQIKYDIELLLEKIEGLWQLDFYSLKERVDRYGDDFAFVTPGEMLNAYIASMIYNASTWLKNKQCPYHVAICDEWLSKGDTVISFNYDLIIDSALKQSKLEWNEYTGYGFWSEFGHFIKSGKVKDSEVSLLKPHGSINWFKLKNHGSIGNKDSIPFPQIEEKVTVTDIDYALLRKEFLRGEKNVPFYQMEAFLEHVIHFKKHPSGSLEFYLPCIVTPTPYKNFPKMKRIVQLNTIWEKIKESIWEADEIVAAGFSFRDEYFNQILFHGLEDKERKVPLTIVTKGEEAESEIKDKLKGFHVNIRDSNLNGLGSFVKTL